MRISEQRYSKDRRTLDAATRLVDFEARTSTIQELTGLTGDRIRSLSKACGVSGKGGGPRLRHRGAPPRRVGNFLNRPHTKAEAAALLSLCQLMGVEVSRSANLPPLDRVARTERLCDAYWTFRYLSPESSIGFEQMLLLLAEAGKAEEIATGHCRACNALVVEDVLSLRRRLCRQCGEEGYISTADEREFRCVAEESAAYR